MKKVYLDHAATTPVDPEVFEAMRPYFSEKYGNPSSLYAIGQETRRALENARKIIGDFLGTNPYNIIFTSGGTESINTAILGAARKHKNYGKHIITSQVEHKAVLNSCKKLEKEGFEVTYLPVDEYGFVRIEDLKNALHEDTVLVSIMYANNEVGTVEPIAEIGREILKWRKDHGDSIYPLFHTDACQATNYLDMNVERLHVDLLSLNGSKMYAPKGVGVLFKRKGLEIEPLILGGGQEMGLRGGTEDVPSIVGLGKAVELTQANKEEANRVKEVRDYFWQQIQSKIEKVRLNGPELDGINKRLPNNLNASILDIEGEALLLYLDAQGIYCSSGSACNSDSLDPSHVLTACGLPYEYSHGSLRFTLGKHTTKQEIDYVMEHLPGIVEKLRKMSPVHLVMDKDKSKHPKYHQREN